MKAYLGYYMARPDQWFFILARSPGEAMEHVDSEWGEPDARSLIEVKGPVAFQFAARLESEGADEDPVVVCEADASDGGMSLGDGAGYDDAHDWVKERLLAPFGPPAQNDYDATDAMLGKPMSREWKKSVEDAGKPPRHDKVRK